MSTLTPHYGLHLPEDTDSMDDFFSNYESDMETIDDHLGSGGGATIEEMTQAEYEALPDTKLTDGILRGLKDVKSFLDADILYLGTCYSTSERMVGCWVDGKPLYQRILTLTQDTTLATDSWVKTEFNKDTMETLVRVDATIGTSGAIIEALSGGFIDGKLALNSARNVGLNVSDNARLIVQYTKSTDAAGSGTWTPSGVNAVHYDTNEQVIGTWIDGKPLYQKSFTLPSTITINNTNWTNTGITIPNIKNVIDGELNRNAEQLFACSFGLNNSEIKIQSYYNGAQCNTDSVITIRYTKTTD